MHTSSPQLKRKKAFGSRKMSEKRSCLPSPSSRQAACPAPSSRVAVAIHNLIGQAPRTESKDRKEHPALTWIEEALSFISSSKRRGNPVMTTTKSVNRERKETEDILEKQTKKMPLFTKSEKPTTDQFREKKEEGREARVIDKLSK